MPVGLTSPPVWRLDRPLWTLYKAEHIVAARMRVCAWGLEIRIHVDEELRWSRVYQTADVCLIADDSERRRKEFEADGWA